MPSQNEKWIEEFDQMQLYNLLNIPKLKSFIQSHLSLARAEAIEEEKLGWLRGERCHTCGKEMEHKDLSDTCKDCWETE